MSISARPDGPRFARKWLEPEVPPVLRRGREHRIVRWIGAAGRRASKPAGTEAPDPAEAPATFVIRLSWAETFGRPARPDPAGSGPSVAQVLPFQGHPSGGARTPPPRRRAVVQPSVPVLR